MLNFIVQSQNCIEIIEFPFTHVEGCCLSNSPPHLLQAPHSAKFGNFIAEAYNVTYFISLRKGRKEKNKKHELLSSEMILKKMLFYCHCSSLILYHISMAIKILLDLNVWMTSLVFQVVHIREDTNILEKVCPIIDYTCGILFFQIYEYVPCFWKDGSGF